MLFLTEKEENKLRDRAKMFDEKIENEMPELNDINKQIAMLQKKRDGVYGRITMLRNERNKCNRELNENIKNKKYANINVNISDVFPISFSSKKYTPINFANVLVYTQNNNGKIDFEIVIDSETKKFFVVKIVCNDDIKVGYKGYYDSLAMKKDGAYHGIKITKNKLKDFLNENSIGFKRDMNINNIFA